MNTIAIIYIVIGMLIASVISYLSWKDLDDFIGPRHKTINTIEHFLAFTEYVICWPTQMLILVCELIQDSLLDKET